MKFRMMLMLVVLLACGGRNASAMPEYLDVLLDTYTPEDALKKLESDELDAGALPGVEAVTSLLAKAIDE